MPNLNTKAEDGDIWLSTHGFFLLLAVLAIASYPQIVFGLQTFVHRDFGYFSYPIAYHLRESFWHGEVPLWNPLNNCGQPFLAEWNTQVLYPPALFYLVLPLPYSLNVFCLLHLLLGGCGMFYLTQCWTRNRFAAAFAGIIFTFNGLALNSLMWPATIAGLGWMPWVIWLTERAWRNGGRTVIIAAIVGALQMLSGAVEVILLTWSLLGTMCLVEFIHIQSTRGRMLLRAILVVLLVSGLCAAQLLPFLDLLNHSHRQENYNASFQVFESSMPMTGWINFFVPLFHCQSTQGVFMQTSQYWTDSYYVGVITMALAMWAVWQSRCRRVWLLAAATLFCLVLALGNTTPIYSWLHQHIFIIRLMRFPVKFVILPTFALPLLAAFGLAKMQHEAGSNSGRSKKQWSLICLATLALIFGIIGWNFLFHLPGEDTSVVLFNGLARAVFFIAILCGLFFLEKISSLKLCWLLQILVLLLIWLDLYRHTLLPPTVNPAIFKPDMPRPFPAPQFGAARALIPDAARTRLTLSTTPQITDDYLSHRYALFCNCNLLDDIPKCDGFFPLYLREQSLLYTDLADPMLDFIGACQVITIQTDVLVWTPRSTFMPLLTGGQKPLFSDDTKSVHQLANTNFNPRQEVYLPLEAKPFITVTNFSVVKISSEKFSAQQVEAKVEADAPAMLVAAQTYYHPWHAFVDGQPTRLWRANYAFQALEVSAGSHQVKLVYEDRRFYLGVMISLTTLAGCFIFPWLALGKIPAGKINPPS